MKDFDIAKFLRENQLGSYGILNHYVDIKPLKEEEVAEDTAPAKGEYVVYFKNKEMDKPKEYKRVKDKWEAETAASNGYEFYKDDYLDYQWGYWPAEKWDAWVSKTVSEDVTPEETAEIPYKGPEPKLDGLGDEFKQADTVSEEETAAPEQNDIYEKIVALKKLGYSSEEIIAILMKDFKSTAVDDPGF